jgi:hypothetical protein
MRCMACIGDEPNWLLISIIFFTFHLYSSFHWYVHRNWTRGFKDWGTRHRQGCDMWSWFYSPLAKPWNCSECTVWYAGCSMITTGTGSVRSAAEPVPLGSGEAPRTVHGPLHEIMQSEDRTLVFDTELLCQHSPVVGVPCGLRASPWQSEVPKNTLVDYRTQPQLCSHPEPHYSDRTRRPQYTLTNTAAQATTTRRTHRLSTL